jgi:positive control factor
MINQLIYEYKQSLKAAREMYTNASEEDKKIISGMISDIEYAIEWMEKCRMPGNRRGIERRAAYQREKPFDPLMMQKYFRSSEQVYEWDDHEQEDKLSDWDMQRIEDALSVLTEKEKEVYLMSRGHCLSYSQIANYLCISRGAVQKMIERAEKKIAERITESLFCLCG